MRTTLLLLVVCLSSCISRPSVTEFRPDGTKIRYSTGANVMGEADEVLAEVEAPNGVHLRYAAKREDGTRVPLSAIAAWLTKGLANIQAGVTNLKTKTDGQVALGAQQVELGKAQIASDEAIATFVPPVQP